MIEIRMHGRGGQGAVVACKILASALYQEGKFAQSFPAFGVERRGAPILAFIRIDDRPILLRTEVYEPDHLVVLDSTLLQTVDVTAGLKPGGRILINSARPASSFDFGADYRVAVVDGSGIAVRHGVGNRTTPIVNTAMLGAFSRFTGLVGIEAIEKAIRDSVPFKPDANAAATLDAYREVIMPENEQGEKA